MSPPPQWMKERNNCLESSVSPHTLPHRRLVYGYHCVDFNGRCIYTRYNMKNKNNWVKVCDTTNSLWKNERKISNSPMSLNTQGNVVAIRITNTSPDVAYTRTVYAPQSHRPADSLCYEKIIMGGRWSGVDSSPCTFWYWVLDLWNHEKMRTAPSPLAPFTGNT